MFSVTYAQLNAWLTAFLWPFARILALFATAPIISQTAVPREVKVGLAAFVTLIVAPTLGPMPQATVFSADGVWILANQFLIGAALGFTMTMTISAIEAAGEMMGLSMGFGFASFFDPTLGSTASALSSWVNMIAMLSFLVLDGHLQMIAALVATFQSAPISPAPPGAAGWRDVANWCGIVFSSGLLLALPVVTALLITNLALGILNRSAPQIGVFQVGFAVAIVVGLLLLEFMLPNMIPFFAQLFDTGMSEMGIVAAALGR